MLFKVTSDRTVHPDFSINENDVQTKKDRWNMVKKEFEAQD